MSNLDYKKQLQELSTAYGNEVVAEAIGVSVRSVQNYLNPDNEFNPRKEAVEKIRECFAKHKEGLPIVDKKETDENLTALIRNNTKLTDAIYDMTQMLKKRDESLELIQANLKQLPIDMTALTAKVQVGQQQILDIVGKLVPETSRSKKSSQSAKR